MPKLPPNIVENYDEIQLFPLKDTNKLRTLRKNQKDPNDAYVPRTKRLHEKRQKPSEGDD